MKRLTALPVLFLLALPLSAASTRTWEMNTYDDFLKGRFDGISLVHDGRLRLAPKMETLFTSDQPAVWSVARADDGTVYLGTGHRGLVYRVSKSGKSELIWTADEPEVWAVALDKQGRLFAATSPNGKVYLLADGQATEYFAPNATYIWSLAFGDDGKLYVGTGGEGKIYRVSAPGEGELYYDTGQAHVTALALDSNGRLLAGTEPNGILYRISEKDRAFVLYDTNLPEIRSLAPMPDGTVYAAALGGSVARQVAEATSPLVTAPTGGVAHTSVTVSAAQGGVEIQPPPASPTPAATPAPAMALSFPATTISGVEKSALFRILPDNTVEKLWTSTEENAYGLLVSDRRIVLSTDHQGRLYELDPEGRATLLLQANEGEAIRIIHAGEELLVATSGMGKIYRVGKSPGERGVYEAPAHDASRVARWGRLSWKLAPDGGGAIHFETRSGNSARPDRTWSDWSAPLSDSDGSQITSPNARYIQWRAVFDGARGATPVLDSVSLAYLPPNAAPKVTSIAISNYRAANGSGQAASPQSASSAAYSITVTDTGEDGASTVSGTSTQRLVGSGSDRLRISWQSEDLDGDKLVYRLYFRGEGEREWKLMKGDLEPESYNVASDALADGKYYFKVVASDERANPAGTERQGQYVSVPVLIDHTPPVLSAGRVRRSGNTAAVVVDAVDAASSLDRCEYSLDAGTWTPLAAADGIVDAKRERFEVRLDNLNPGERLLVVRAYDSANNAGLVKVILR